LAELDLDRELAFLLLVSIDRAHSRRAIRKLRISTAHYVFLQMELGFWEAVSIDVMGG